MGEVTTATIATAPKKHSFNHLSVHQWILSAICASQQPTSPIGFSYFWNFRHRLVRYYWYYGIFFCMVYCYAILFCFIVCHINLYYFSRRYHIRPISSSFIYIYIIFFKIKIFLLRYSILYHNIPYYVTIPFLFLYFPLLYLLYYIKSKYIIFNSASFFVRYGVVLSNAAINYVILYSIKSSWFIWYDLMLYIYKSYCVCFF